MKKINFNFTDDEIKKMIYSVINENLMWINKIDRAEFDTLDGTCVTLKSRATNSTKVIEIQFLHDKLEVQGTTKEVIRKLYKAYFNEVFKKIPEYAATFEESKEEIQTFIKENQQQIKELMMDVLFEGGFASTDYVKQKVAAYRLSGVKQDDIKIGNHVTFAQLPTNRFNTDKREIKIGSVYIVNLDPVVGEEFGGIRPCVVIGRSADKKNYICVPLSTKSYLGKSVGQIQGNDSYAVASRLKIVSPERIYEYISDLDEENYTKVINEVNKNTLIFSSTSTKESDVSLVSDEKEEDVEDVPVLPHLVNNINYMPKNALAFDTINKNLIPLTETEIMDIVNRWVVYKRKDNWQFVGSKNTSVAYEYFVDGEKQKVKLNVNHVDISKKYYPIEITFDKHEVFLSTDGTGVGKHDKFMTYAYVYKRLEKDDKYFISLFERLVRKTHNIYKKLVEREGDDDDDSKFEDKLMTLKHLMETYKISYSGNWEDLVLHGSRAIDLELIKYEDESASEKE